MENKTRYNPEDDPQTIAAESYLQGYVGMGENIVEYINQGTEITPELISLLIQCAKVQIDMILGNFNPNN